MAKKTQGTGDKGQESAEPATSPALSLDPDYSQETVSQETISRDTPKTFIANDDLHAVTNSRSAKPVYPAQN